MLPIKHRLKKKKDFEIIFKQGKNIKNKLFFLKFLSTQNNYSRIGIVVSKKIAKQAVKRNKIKRQLRAATKKVIEAFSSKVDIIIIALPPIKKARYQEIEQSISTAFKNII
jgi:ribonuclease P protein component